MENTSNPGQVDPDTGPPVESRYQPPMITRLGTLSELTLGPGQDTDDVVGGLNGDIGGSL